MGYCEEQARLTHGTLTGLSLHTHVTPGCEMPCCTASCGVQTRLIKRTKSYNEEVIKLIIELCIRYTKGQREGKYEEEEEEKRIENLILKAVRCPISTQLSQPTISVLAALGHSSLSASTHINPLQTVPPTHIHPSRCNAK